MNPESFEYGILNECSCGGPEEFSVLVSTVDFEDDQEELEAYLKALVRLVNEGYLECVREGLLEGMRPEEKVSRLTVSDLQAYISVRREAGEELDSYPIVTEEYVFAATDEGCCQLLEEDRPISSDEWKEHVVAQAKERAAVQRSGADDLSSITPDQPMSEHDQRQVAAMRRRIEAYENNQRGLLLLGLTGDLEVLLKVMEGQHTAWKDAVLERVEGISMMYCMAPDPDKVLDDSALLVVRVALTDLKGLLSNAEQDRSTKSE